MKLTQLFAILPINLKAIIIGLILVILPPAVGYAKS